MLTKEQTQVGDIALCIGKSWISRAIMKVTKGKFSHTALIVEVWGQKGVIEAQKNGVNFKMWDAWRKAWNYDYVIARRINIDGSRLTDSHKKEISLKAFSKSGETKYDFFTFFFRIPKRLIGLKNREKENEDLKMICSEFTAWVHDLPGWFEMTPHEQYILLKDHPDFILIH